MKRALLAATALISASLSPFAVTPAFADATQAPSPDGPDADTQAAMQTQCDALAAAHGPATGENDHWTGEVVPGGATLISGPTEVSGSRVIDESSIVGTGTFVPSHPEIRGNPYRIGGSVNLFGDQWATAGYYPDSTYNYTANFTSTFAYAFSCNVSKETFHAGDPAGGEYQINPTLIGTPQAGAALQECNAYNTAHAGGANQGFWGNSPQGNCIFNPQPTQDSWDPPVLIETDAGIPVNQDETDNLSGFEPHGGPVQVTGDYFVGQVVVCISPGSKGGSWRAQNGYGGGSWTGPAAGCNTPYFKIAPWGSGSTTSQGTFVSVPNYSY